MSAEPKRVTKTEVWVGWENQVINSAYPLRRFLGGSNHSHVFLTEYRPEGVAQAAIKLVPADTLETEAQLVQWGTAATLNHPHLIRIFDVGRCHISGRVYLYVVMEYADQTLAQLLPRRALTPDETREMLIPTLSALNFLHRNKLVQGQVKPTNLLVVGDQVKLASDTIRSVGKLSSGILRASLHDPPELKEGEIGPAGDIWGLGVTLIEALTQHPPSWPDARSETVSLTASIPPLFVDTVRRCLNRDPANRPNAGELEGQFNPAVHAHPITVVAAEEPVYEVATVSTAASNEDSSDGTARKGPGSGVLVLGVATVLVLGLAVWVSRTIFVSHFETTHIAGAADASGDTPAVVAQAGGPSAGAGTGSQAGGAVTGTDSQAGGHAVGAGSQAAGHAVGAGLQADGRDGTAGDGATGDSAGWGTPGSAAAPSSADSASGSVHVTSTGYAVGARPGLRGTSDARSANPETARSAVGGTDSSIVDAPSAPASAAAPAHGTASTSAPAAAPARAATSATVSAAVLARATVPPSASHATPASAASASPAAVGSPAGGAVGSVPNTDLSTRSPDIVGSVLHQQLPDIPHNIREKIRGHVNVTVRVLVDPIGNVVGEFLESAGPSRYFARQAGDAAIDWKFVPTDGRGPRVWMLKFEFTRAGTTVHAVGTQ
jgi:hypothetical protein